MNTKTKIKKLLKKIKRNPTQYSIKARLSLYSTLTNMTKDI